MQIGHSSFRCVSRGAQQPQTLTERGVMIEKASKTMVFGAKVTFLKGGSMKMSGLAEAIIQDYPFPKLGGAL